MDKSVLTVSKLRIGSLSFDDDDETPGEKNEKSVGEAIVSAASKSGMSMPESSSQEEEEEEEDEIGSSASRKRFGSASLLNSPLSSSCKVFSLA